LANIHPTPFGIVETPALANTVDKAKQTSKTANGTSAKYDDGDEAGQALLHQLDRSFICAPELQQYLRRALEAPRRKSER
jgi:hypothetical protein